MTLMTEHVPIKNTQIKSSFTDSGMIQVKCFKLIYRKVPNVMYCWFHRTEVASSSFSAYPGLGFTSENLQSANQVNQSFETQVPYKST